MDIRKQSSFKGKKRGVNSVDGLPVRRQNTLDVRRSELVPLRRQPLPPPPAIKQKKTSDIVNKAQGTGKPIRMKLSLSSIKQFNRPLITDVRRRVAKAPRKTKLIGGAMFTIALVALGGHYWLTGNNTTTASNPNTTNAKPDLVRGTPSHAVILPEGRSIKSYDGSTWVNPPDRTPVFVYVDTIGSVPINISQQPLPKEFQPDPAAKIAQIAASFKANEKVSIGNTVIHIGTSDDGAQSIMFNKDDLLVSMTSKSKLETSKWVEYIESLQ